MDIKREIRAKLFGLKSSVKKRGKKDEKFAEDVFKELDGLMETVFEKHSELITHKECHEIVDMWPMTRRFLQKLHEGIYRRLRSTPTSSSPYYCSFTREVPKEIFNIMWKRIINNNSFGNTVNKTPCRITITITDKRKAVYLFNRMNKDGIIIEKEKLLKREFPDSGVAEVLISQTQPLIMKFSLNTEVLSLNYSYGYWNSFGVPQH